ncbi:MAG: F-type H+-transporting synthase subunit [Gammaproteobacteria bacterium]|nr:F-type H+-transporting synthase subunit [Gammaproteobacteria bacterium]
MNFNATFLGQTIAFIFFVWFCMKFIWPLLLGMLEAREKRIADGLAAGERGEKKLEEAEQYLLDLVHEGKQKASEIITQAQKRGDEIIDEAKETARTEGKRILEGARGEIEQEKETARQDLRQQVAQLALLGAEQILMREVDRNAHNEVLNKISADL